MLSSLENSLIQKIQNGENISPFLFVGGKGELLQTQIAELGKSILQRFEIPSTNLFVLSDDGESIKISAVKEFFQIAKMKSPYQVQIFFLENISRMTLQTSNSLLKILEEPGKQNIIFLTNASESGVLDTILSRVQVVHMGGGTHFKKDVFFEDLLQPQNRDQLVSYFFSNKYEKEEYVRFLKTLVSQGNCMEFLDDLESDIQAVEGNNVNARAVVDKWILKVI